MDLTDDEIKIKICETDFIQKLEKSFELAGGGSLESFRKMTGDEIIDVFARNGLRLIFFTDCHMNAVTENQVKLVRIGMELSKSKNESE